MPRLFDAKLVVQENSEVRSGATCIRTAAVSCLTSIATASLSDGFPTGPMSSLRYNLHKCQR